MFRVIITAAAALIVCIAPAAVAQDVLTTSPVVPEGLYPCENADPAAPKRKMLIENETNYAVHMSDGAEIIPGLYRFRGGKLEWQSGPLKGRAAGSYEVDGMGGGFRMRLTFVEDLQTPYICRLPPAPPKPTGP